MVQVIEVLKHVDFVPTNLIVTGPGRLTLIDAVLRDVGLPEDDLAPVTLLIAKSLRQLSRSPRLQRQFHQLRWEPDLPDGPRRPGPVPLQQTGLE